MPVDNRRASSPDRRIVNAVRCYVYILECSDGTYYVGSTTNIEARVHQRQTGIGGDYTRRRRPVRLAFYQEMESIEAAYAMERRIHAWSHQKRQALIDGDFERLKALARRRGRQEGTASEGRG